MVAPGSDHNSGAAPSRAERLRSDRADATIHGEPLLSLPAGAARRSAYLPRRPAMTWHRPAAGR